MGALSQALRGPSSDGLLSNDIQAAVGPLSWKVKAHSPLRSEEEQWSHQVERALAVGLLSEKALLGGRVWSCC